jgi:hypothetical protein
MHPRRHEGACFLPCALALWAALWAAGVSQGEDTKRPSGAVPASASQPAYAPIGVTWEREELKDVRGAWPHPALPQRIVLASGRGLLLSENAGATWGALEGASRQKAGVIRDAAFRPDNPDVFYLASDTRGVWATADAGKTFRQIGSRQTGLASDSAAGICVDRDDPHFRTLCVYHGASEPGISISHDRGRTWQVVAREYHVRGILGGLIEGRQRKWMVVASTKAAPRVQSAYACDALEDLWSEVVRDFVYTGGGVTFSGKEAVLATADKGLLRASEAGSNRVGPEQAASFAGVGVTWGRHADEMLVYAYEPAQLGMVASLDGLKTFQSFGQGLLVGPLVKEGAEIRANANGRVFYVVANGALYRGCVAGENLTVCEAAVAPAVLTYNPNAYERALERAIEENRFAPRERGRPPAMLRRAEEEAAKAMGSTEFRLTARIVSTGEKPKSVTVNLSPLSGAPETPLHDDGLHGDGAAGDGVYGTTFRLGAGDLRLGARREQWMPSGPLGLSVKAVGEAGTIAGAVAVFSVYALPESIVWWDEDRFNPLAKESGEVEIDKNPPRSEAFSGSMCMKWSVQQGAWRTAYGSAKRPINASGFHAVSFLLRSDGPEDQEVYVQLRDAPVYDNPVQSKPVPVAAEKLIEGGKITAKYARVVIPLERFVKDSPHLRAGRLGWIVFSGQGKSPATFWVDYIRFHAGPEDAPQTMSAPSQ